MIPARGDVFEAWLKAKRQENNVMSSRHSERYWAYDHLLDEYRFRADFGLHLDEPIPEEIAYML